MSVVVLRRAFSFVALAGVAFSAACGSDRTAAPVSTNPSIVGVYNLESINGQTLPYVALPSADDPLSIIEGYLTISADSTWHESLVIRSVAHGQTEDQVTDLLGQWTSNAAGITMSTPDNAVAYTVKPSGNKLGLSNSSASLVYTK